MRLSYIFLVLVFGFIVSCKSDKSEDETVDVEHSAPSSQENIETLFDQTVFASEIENKLLKELEICNPSQTDLTNHDDPACHPKFFKFFTYIDGKKINDAFALQIKSRVQGFPLRRLLVFEREAGELVKVNGFVANLIGKRKSETKHDDLVLRFSDNVGGGEIAFYNCLYQWEDKHYVFKKVEQINDANLKVEYQDSMNTVISQILEKNRMVF